MARLRPVTRPRLYEQVAQQILALGPRQRARRRRPAPARARARQPAGRQPGDREPGAGGDGGRRRGRGPARRRCGDRGRRRARRRWSTPCAGTRSGCPTSSRPARRWSPSWPRLAAVRRTEEDLARIDAALDVMAARHRGRRPRRRGRRAVPRRGDRRRPLRAAAAADGRDQRPDQGDPDRVAVPARPARGSRSRATGGSPQAIRGAGRRGAAAAAMRDHVAQGQRRRAAARLSAAAWIWTSGPAPCSAPASAPAS